MKAKIPTFASGEAVLNPYDTEISGHVRSQNGGSVVVRWCDGSTSSVGAFALDKWRDEPDLSSCEYFRGVGSCSGSASCSLAGEPKCYTEEPADGWPSKRPRA